MENSGDQNANNATETNTRNSANQIYSPPIGKNYSVGVLTFSFSIIAIFLMIGIGKIICSLLKTDTQEHWMSFSILILLIMFLCAISWKTIKIFGESLHKKNEFQQKLEWEKEMQELDRERKEKDKELREDMEIYKEKERVHELAKIEKERIHELARIDKENLHRKETYDFFKDIFKNEHVNTIEFDDKKIRSISFYDKNQQDKKTFEYTENISKTSNDSIEINDKKN